MGVSGSGKSTVGELLAERLQRPFIDGDTLHPAENIRKMGEGTPLTGDDRWPWLEEIGKRLADDPRTIIACSALRRDYRDRIRHHAKGPVTFIHLTGSYETLRERMDHRDGHFMPPALLDSQLATLEPPRADERAVEVTIEQPVPAIVDAVINQLSTKETS